MAASRPVAGREREREGKGKREREKGRERGRVGERGQEEDLREKY